MRKSMLVLVGLVAGVGSTLLVTGQSGLSRPETVDKCFSVPTSTEPSVPVPCGPEVSQAELDRLAAVGRTVGKEDPVIAWLDAQQKRPATK